MATARVSPSPPPSPPASAPAFLSRVRSFVEVLNNSSNFDEGNIDNLLTRGSFLYHPAVRVASTNIVGEATIPVGEPLSICLQIWRNRKTFPFNKM